MRAAKGTIYLASAVLVYYHQICTGDLYSAMHDFSSPFAGVPGETGLLSAGVSARCKPPHCVPQVAAGVAAPSCLAPLGSLDASLRDLQQAQSEPGSAIEILRYLLGVKAGTYLFCKGLSSKQ